MSQDHQDPKALWGLQATPAGVALQVIQDALECGVPQALKVIQPIMQDFLEGITHTLEQNCVISIQLLPTSQ